MLSGDCIREFSGEELPGRHGLQGKGLSGKTTRTRATREGFTGTQGLQVKCLTGRLGVTGTEATESSIGRKLLTRLMLPGGG